MFYTQFYKQIHAVYQDVAVREKDENYSFSAPELVFKKMKALRMETKEHFIVLHLDAKNKILCQDVVSIGTGNSSLVSAKEVMKTALLSSAEALILVHNHPSGDTKPSQEDIQVTKKISKAAELFSIRVLDHIVIGDNYYSFAENGDL